LPGTDAAKDFEQTAQCLLKLHGYGTPSRTPNIRRLRWRQSQSLRYRARLCSTS
jgi:hypothetical protein